MYKYILLSFQADEQRVIFFTPLHPQAAIHGEHLAGNGIGLLGKKQFYHLNNPLGVTEFRDGRSCNDLFTHSRWYFPNHAFVHVSGRDAIHGNVISCQLRGHGPG